MDLRPVAMRKTLDQINKWRAATSGRQRLGGGAYAYTLASHEEAGLLSLATAQKTH